jgi:hypothetical protein
MKAAEQRGRVLDASEKRRGIEQETEQPYGCAFLFSF